MSGVEDVDFFTDSAVVANPYSYFDELRAQCPVRAVKHPGVIAVTGYDEAVEVYADSTAFSSCNAVSGPFPGLPVQADGDDISELIEQYRHQLPMSDLLVNLDEPAHHAQRALLRRLLTPSRLKTNEATMWRLADSYIDRFIETGTFEVMSDYAKPFSLLVIADLLGVPEDDREEFGAKLGAEKPAPGVGEDTQAVSNNPLEFLHERFTTYIEERRRRPRADVLTDLANVTYKGGSTPEVDVIVGLATFLFAAGQDTTARLITSAMWILAENPDIQQRLREDRKRIPVFLEETLRFESPTMSDFRLTRVTTTIAGQRIPAGTTVMIHPGAANRDPRKFTDPETFQLDRDNAVEHIAFGRGAHSCPGGPLARTEGRVSIERFLDRMTDIRVSETTHGPAPSRTYEYEPSFILRGLRGLQIDFTPVD
ncbi:cytochrome P450 [Frankia sp. CNm7]|uniref:Cytochrome P450 n=1 Tax=Frankia nepalensis TaxID=1836974 RepID=A0A937UJI9_9ACTN|nr:cytochrome P450 [Frankia nepalensis]MBL7502532.1 cytochrome P450 [Frankia nepalensis]MBL7516501.1 cytochrome P450 [Frankia nepalensis]MBL7518183.1 cytochrome P450 [Frankia nepalensis]MBL7625844.1 cytochrome P450 [Frankia nepalensis]